MASKTFLQGFDKAVRLRQMHEKNKLELNRHGVEEFFDINMMSGTRIRSAMSVPEASTQINKNKSKKKRYKLKSYLIMLIFMFCS